MTDKPDKFTGFSKSAVKFFRDLKKNNNKEWFNGHKDFYKSDVVAPAQLFVIELGNALKKITPKINADPRVNKSLFRINRDVRFAADKSPYKTWMGLWLWEGAGPRMESSGYYFQLEPPNIMVAAGMHTLPQPLLKKYRDAVVDKKLGPELTKTIAKVSTAGFEVGGEHYKRVPRGYDPEHKNADLLRYSGLWTAEEVKIPPQFYTRELIGWCVGRYKKMAPLHNWLTKMLER